MTSPPPPSPVPARSGIRTLWTLSLPTRPRGLALARERDAVLVWDDNHWLYVLNNAGKRQAQFQPPAAIGAAACAEDGSAFAVGGAGGELWFLAPDLSIRWQESLPDTVTAVALDPYGQYLAVADSRGNLRIFDRLGRPVAQATCPRPLRFLAFVPQAPLLVGSSDFGLVVCYDAHLVQMWRDVLVINVGSLAVSGDGESIVLACFTEGLQRYSRIGKPQGRLPVPEAAGGAALSYDGRLILGAGLSTRVFLLDAAGQVINTHDLGRPIVAASLSPLGDRAVAVLKDGQVVCIDLSGAWPC